jgi:hypothetical protein
MGLLAALLHKRPWNALAAGTESLRHGGMESAGGAMCHRLKFVRKTGAFDLWVRDGDKPAVMKMTAEISAAPVGTTPATAVKTELTVTFSNWEPNAIIPDETFKPRAQ